MIDNEWSFFSNYAHVLVCLAQNPRALLREVADKVGVTERTAMRLINQLDKAGILERVKQGRRNYYQLVTTEHVQHPLEAHCTIEQLLKPILKAGTDPASPSAEEDNSGAGDSTIGEPLKKQAPQEASK